MQRRNRPRDDEETVPQSTPRRKKKKRSRRRIRHDIEQILRIALFSLLVYVAVECLESKTMGSEDDSKNPKRTSRSRDHHRETGDWQSDLHKTFNQSSDCPFDPIPGYPIHFNLLQMLEVWPIDDIDSIEARHDTFFSSLCIFHWSKTLDREKMERYRKLELPFIITGDPQVLEGMRNRLIDSDCKFRNLKSKSFVVCFSRKSMESA